jgi:hypothetical protein
MAPPSLTSAVGGNKWAASRPGHFTSGQAITYEKVPGGDPFRGHQ